MSKLPGINGIIGTGVLLCGLFTFLEPGEATDRVDCPAGELTFLDPVNYPGLRGRHNVSLAAGETKIYCADIDFETVSLVFEGGDVNQCAQTTIVAISSHHGTRYSSPEEPLPYTGVQARSDTSSPLPKGTWLVMVNNRSTCVTGQYRIYWYGQ